MIVLLGACVQPTVCTYGVVTYGVYTYGVYIYI